MSAAYAQTSSADLAMVRSVTNLVMTEPPLLDDRKRAGDRWSRGARRRPPCRCGSAPPQPRQPAGRRRYAQRSRSRVPSSAGSRSAVAATGPSPGTASRQATRSYGCQSTISSSVASRRSRTGRSCPRLDGRRARRLLDDHRPLPPRPKLRRGEVGPDDRRLGGERRLDVEDPSGSAISSRRIPVSACQRASRSRVNVSTGPRCSIVSWPAWSPSESGSRPRAATAAAVNRAKPLPRASRPRSP